MPAHPLSVTDAIRMELNLKDPAVIPVGTAAPRADLSCGQAAPHAAAEGLREA